MDTQQILKKLDQLPIWPYPKKLLLIIGIGFFFSFFDIVTIGLALPVIQQQFSITTKVATWAITSSLIGYILGSFLDSRISDLFGRKLALYLSILFFSIGSICSAFTHDITTLMIWRFIIGMGSGSEIANISTYLAELTPARIRGKITSMAVASGMFGFAIVPFVADGLVPFFAWGWRALFIIGGCGGIVTLFMRRLVPDSPRWLLTQHRTKEAEDIVNRAELFVRERIKNFKPAPIQASPKPSVPHSFVSVLNAYKERLILFVLLWGIYYIGNYAWLTLSTSLFIQEGFRLGLSLWFVSVASLGFVLGSLIAVSLSDHFERQWLVFCTLLLWSIALLVIAWIPRDITLLLFGFIASTTIAIVIPILYAYTAENFPTAQRSTCVSITDDLGHLGGAFCGQIILGIASLFTVPYAFAAAFTSMALTGVLAACLSLLGTRMTRRQLE